MATPEEFAKFLKSTNTDYKIYQDGNIKTISTTHIINKRPFEVKCIFSDKHFAIETRLCYIKKVNEELKEKQLTFFLSRCCGHNRTISDFTKIYISSGQLLLKYCNNVPPSITYFDNIKIAYNYFINYINQTKIDIKISKLEEKPYGGYFD